MRFVLTPVGSGGDVHPFLGIGRELRLRGHEVVMITNEVFRGPIENAGLAFVPFGTAAEFQESLNNPDLWHPHKGLKVVMKVLGENLRALYDLIESVYEPNTVLVGHSLSFSTRIFEETHNAAAATIHLSPSIFRSDFEQPAIMPNVNPTGWPRPLRRLLWSMVDRFAIDPTIAPAINRLRSELGLAPVSRIFRDWLHSPNRVLALFPSWFATPQPDWPPQLSLSGFPLFDAPDDHVDDPDLDAWISESEPPVVFTPGTANIHARPFFEAALEATGRIGGRALFLTRFESHLPQITTDRVRHVPYIPLSRVLPRCAAIVHHGGIGTCAQGLAAGIPQLVMPMGFDQPDNAERLVKLGTGTWISPGKFTGLRVAAALEQLINDSTTASTCNVARERVAAENGIATSCDALERLKQRA